MNIKHNHSRRGMVTSEFVAWRNMLDRCYRPKHRNFRYYGAKGVTVCERWRDIDNGFVNFLTDMGAKPTPKHSIDRLDNKGNYEPTNCAWRTAREQCKNRTTSRYITFNGYSQILAEWARELKMKPDVLRSYLTRHTFEEAYARFSSKNYKKWIK